MSNSSKKFTTLSSPVEKMSQAEIYQYATDSSSIVSITDGTGVIIHVNNRFCEISGYSQDELIGKNHNVVNSGIHTGSYFKDMWTTLNSGKEWSGEICNKAKSGELYWVDTKITPIWDEDKNIYQYISIRSDITDRKREEELRYQEKENLSYVLESTKTGMFQYYPASGKLDCDSTFLNVLELDSHYLDTNMDKFLSHIHHEDIGKFKRRLNSHFKGNIKSFNLLFRIIHPSGRIINTLCRGKVTKWDENKKPILFVGTISDLSEQLGVERLLNTTQEVARIGSWEFNVLTNKLFWSSVVYSIHGYEPYSFEPTVEDGINFYVPEHQEIIAREFENSMKTGSKWDQELKIVHSSGEGIWVRAMGQCEMVNGKPVRVYGTFQDINDKKQIELELKDSKKQLDLALESAGIGIWEYFPKEDKLIWDEYMHQLFGKNESVFKGTYSCWESCLLPEDIEKTSGIFIKCLEKRETIYDASFKILTSEGELRHIQARAFIEYDDEFKPERVVGLDWDITKEKEFQSYLIEARDRAQEATKAKSAFLASMSHEIRTPMNGVLGMLELLEDTDLNSDQRDLISTIKICSDNLLDIVNDVLDFSKIEAGKMDIENRVFDLHELLEQIQDIFQLTAQKKGLNIRFEKGDGLPEYIVSDQVRLKQVLTNLISNGLKFTEEGEVVVECSVLNYSSNSNQAVIEFSVSDTGIGIPVDKQELLFGSFSQVDGSTTRRFGGSGLGLAISKSLVEKMGGSIGVESKFGAGSTFKFSIAAEIENNAQKDKKPSIVTNSFDSNISVLVAEDNLTNQKLVRKYFEKIGVKLSIASDGVEALELMSQQEFNIVFMDIQMPRMDGISATKEMKTLYKSACPPVVAMTANVFMEDQQRCFEAGMIDFLGKPVSRKKIVEILSKYCPGDSNVLDKELKMSESKKNLIDCEQILFEFADDFDIFCELVEDFSQEQAQMIDELSQAISAGDAEKVRISAHTIKGIVSNFYASDLTSAAFALEEMGHNKDLSRAEAALDSLRNINENVIAELNRFISEHEKKSKGEAA